MACMSTMSLKTVTGLGSGIQTSSFKASPSVRMTPTLRQVRCQAENETKPTPPPASTPASPAVPPAYVAPPVVKKASTNFGDIFAFSGPGPETINGRLAMLGFVTAIGVELSTGAPLTQQLADNASFSWFIFSTALFSAASLVPMFQGISNESKATGFWSAGAEKLNGRAAMIGLIALAITEYVKGSALL